MTGWGWDHPGTGGVSPRTLPASVSVRPAAGGRGALRFLHDLLDRQCELGPARQSLVSGGEAWSFGELRDRATGLAHRMLAYGVRSGDRVIIHAANGPGVVAAVFACSYAGAVAVVLHPRIRPFHLAHIVADCRPALAMADSGLAGLHDGTGVRVIPLETGTTTASEAGRLPPAGMAEVALACLIYTSGSTGLPKAVMSPHQQMMFATEAIGSVLRYRPDDIVFSCLPLSFDYGLYQVFLSVAAGALLVLEGDSSAGPSLLRRLEASEATVFPLVPALAAMLTRLIDRATGSGLRLRLITNTGEALQESQVRALRARIPGLEVALMYGLTECKRVSIHEPVSVTAHPGSVGRPLPGTRCAVVDGAGRRLPVGGPGELIVSGPHVMPGYWNAPELTRSRFRPGPDGRIWLHTGDICRIDEDGHIYFLGRDDDIYKRQGFRISAAEVEKAALDIPGVEQAALLPPAAGAPPRLFASGHIAAADVLAGLRARLEPAKVPETCTVLPTALPLTPHGKTDKAALRALGQRDTAPAQATAPAPVTPRAAAAAYGTPLYIYDLDEVGRAHGALAGALPPGAPIHYSLKANPHPEIARTLADLGCRAEVSSPGELAIALAAGFTCPDITYTGPAKTTQEIEQALRAGVRRFSAESARDLEAVAEAARGLTERGAGDVQCLLRINADQPVPGMGLAMAGVSAKFGVDFAQVLNCPAAYQDADGVRITGLHLYMGSNLPAEDVLLGQFGAALSMCAELAKALGGQFSELDLGGGFGAPYARPGERPRFPGLRAGLERLLDEHVPSWRSGSPIISFESGRYLVGSCGTLVTSVVDVKESKGQRYALLDSGIHHLGGMSGLSRLPPARPGVVLLAAEADAAPPAGTDDRTVRLTGPLCTPVDQWGSLPGLAGLRPGDLLAVPNVGAYGLTASLMGFLSYPAPVEVVTGAGRPTTASRVVFTRTHVERI